MNRRISSTNWLDAGGAEAPSAANEMASAPTEAPQPAASPARPSVIEPKKPTGSCRRRGNLNARGLEPEAPPDFRSSGTPHRAQAPKRLGRDRRHVPRPQPAPEDPPTRRARERRRHGASRRRAVASLIVITTVIGFWFVMLRPTWLGGSASVLTVRGVSMEPTYQFGDVIITARRSTYRVGDIIAFRVPEGEIGAGTVVIHRIIGGDDTAGYIMQGDNNPDPDKWLPVPGDILGVARWRIPKLGRLMAVLQSVPGIAGTAGLVAALLVIFGAAESPDRCRRCAGYESAPDAAKTPSPAVSTDPTQDPPPEKDPPDDNVPLPPPAKPVTDNRPPEAPGWIDADDTVEIVIAEYLTDPDYLGEILRDRISPPEVFDYDLEYPSIGIDVLEDLAHD